MTKQYNKQWLSDGYKRKVCLWLICEFLRTTNTMGEWGRSIKEISLLEFQQWIGAGIVPDDLVDQIEYSQVWKSIRQQRWRKKLKWKQDYERLLKELRDDAKEKSKKNF